MHACSLLYIKMTAQMITDWVKCKKKQEIWKGSKSQSVIIAIL